MALQIISDIHLEAPKAYDFFEIAPQAPVLALLGDIGCVEEHKDDFLDFLTRQLRQFRVVLFVPGNHEMFHSNWKTTIEILKAFEEKIQQERASDDQLGAFVLLERRAYRLPHQPNTVVLGCSLFSHVPPGNQQQVNLRVNDFYQDDEWDVTAHNRAHERDVAWLNEQVVELEKDASVQSIAIFTHWSPSTDVRANDPRHAGSPISTAFSTDLSGETCFQSAKVKLWAFGHTHYNCDFLINRGKGAGSSPLRLFTNQRGYYFSQADGFDFVKTVTV